VGLDLATQSPPLAVKEERKYPWVREKKEDGLLSSWAVKLEGPVSRDARGRVCGGDGGKGRVPSGKKTFSSLAFLVGGMY